MSAACAKCSGEDIYMDYHAQGCDREHCSCSNCSTNSHVKEHSEHLHYHCRTCHFDWIGATADA